MGTVRKRLHISGLTPAITENEISARLHGFGNVLALDGFGMLNAVGEPRKFAYVTFEATESNLARCLNHLSGTTWKGAKLRIGEAKADYAQRLEDERKPAVESCIEQSSKPRRLPRGVKGVHAKNMSIVDLKSSNLRPGWHKTPLSHLIYPMKMRALRPLPKLAREQRSQAPKKIRKRSSTLSVPTRARVQVIDPRLYGAVHLRENMLEALSHETAEVILPASSEPKSISGLVKPAFPENSKVKSLKDMFQPHKEAGGFSLIDSLGQFDVELDPDFELDVLLTPSDPDLFPPPPTMPNQPLLPHGGCTLDPTLPSFFPQPDNPHATDIFALARTEGWEFGRSGDSDTIRKRWDETKVSLTREWKRRAREALKARKRRYGADEGEDA